jgi:hypothetical protein
MRAVTLYQSSQGCNHFFWKFFSCPLVETTQCLEHCLRGGCDGTPMPKCSFVARSRRTSRPLGYEDRSTWSRGARQPSGALARALAGQFGIFFASARLWFSTPLGLGDLARALAGKIIGRRLCRLRFGSARRAAPTLGFRKVCCLGILSARARAKAPKARIYPSQRQRRWIMPKIPMRAESPAYTFHGI